MITAMWQVVGTDAMALLREAHSDCQIAGLKTDNLNVWLMRPHKIVGGRVEAWRGWAVVCHDVSRELLLRTLMEEEWRLALLQSQQSSQG